MLWINQLCLDRFDHPRRIPTHYCPGIDIAKDARASADHSPFADCYARPDKYIRSHPCPTPDPDRGRDDRHVTEPIVVTGRTEEGVLTDRCVRFKDDLIDGITIHIITETAALPHRQIPGGPNSG